MSSRPPLPTSGPPRQVFFVFSTLILRGPSKFPTRFSTVVTVVDKIIPSGGTGVADFRFVADKKPRSSSDSVSATLFFKDAGVQSLRFVANYKNSISFPFSSVDINHSKSQEIDRTIPLFVTKDIMLSDCKVKCTGDVPFLSVALEKNDGTPVVRLRSKVSELDREEYIGKIDLYLNDELVETVNFDVQ